MNGTTNRKSRYFTTIADAQSAGPMLASSARTTNTGSRNICQPGRTRYQIMRPTRMVRLTAKSISATMIVDNGTIMRGKYTLLIKFELVITLADASPNTEENSVQGNRPP